MSEFFFVSMQTREFVHDLATRITFDRRHTEDPRDLLLHSENIILEYEGRIAIDALMMKNVTSETLIPLLREMKQTALRQESTARKADSPQINIVLYRDAWLYVTQEFLTSDYGRFDAVRLARMIASAPLAIIKHYAEKARKLKKFSIGYLHSSVESAPNSDIELMRQEIRRNEAITKSKPAEIPRYRNPGSLSAFIAEHETDAKIEEFFNRNSEG